MTRAPGVPAALAGRDNRIVRPRDVAYADPWAEFRRLAKTGVVIKLATGYYMIPPDVARARGDWLPATEDVALGIAVADYGVDGAVLMGISAARSHAAIPRALAVGIVAVPKQRPALETSRGRIYFVRRRPDQLDRVRVRTEVVQGWATSPEQTILDLADRPELGGVTPAAVSEAITQLAPRCDWELVSELATRQRKGGAFARASWLASAVREDVQFDRRARRPVEAKGLLPLVPVDSERFGIHP